VQSSATPVDAQSSAEPVTKKTRDSLNAQKRRSEQNAADAKHAELIPLGKGRASRWQGRGQAHTVQDGSPAQARRAQYRGWGWCCRRWAAGDE